MLCMVSVWNWFGVCILVSSELCSVCLWFLLC